MEGVGFMVRRHLAAHEAQARQLARHGGQLPEDGGPHVAGHVAQRPPPPRLAALLRLQLPPLGRRLLHSRGGSCLTMLVCLGGH